MGVRNWRGAVGVARGRDMLDWMMMMMMMMMMMLDDDDDDDDACF
jgi:hypothetical protein